MGDLLVLLAPLLVLKLCLDSDLKEIRIFSRDEKNGMIYAPRAQAKHPETAKKVKILHW